MIKLLHCVRLRVTPSDGSTVRVCIRYSEKMMCLVPIALISILVQVNDTVLRCQLEIDVMFFSSL